MDRLASSLTSGMITNVPTNDVARAGVVMLGPLQGNPDPDTARISITIFENDPDRIMNIVGNSAFRGSWDDEVESIEIGGGITWLRKFTVKARCLLEATRENLDEARSIASSVRKRLERTLMTTSFADVTDGSEIVVGGAFNEYMRGEMIQSGGPPDAYDFHIKLYVVLRTFEVLGGS